MNDGPGLHHVAPGTTNGVLPGNGLDHDDDTDWPAFLFPVWDRLDKTNRHKLRGPWDEPDRNYRLSTLLCMRTLRHHGLSLPEVIQAARCFPEGLGKLGGHASLIRDLWREYDEELARAEPDFGETLPFTMFADIQPALDASDFVEDLLTSASLVVVYGEPGSGKTFWTLDLALHVAAGRRWRDRQVEQGAVVYLALEGGPGIRNRIAAARARLEMPANTPLVLVQCPVDLCTSDADVAKAVATIRTFARLAGMPVRLVVVDTLARAFGGGNENASEDMGALVMNSDIIRNQTGACVLYIHHCGKDAARGSRGHSSLKAATDTEIEVTHCEKVSTARVGRQRDLEGGDRFAFQLVQVPLGTNKRGKPVTSCVVVETEAKAAAAGAPLTDNETIAWRCLNQALKADGIMATVFDNNTEGLVVREADWRGQFYRDGKPGESQDTKKKAFQRVRDSLLAKDRIGSRDDFVWPKT